MSGRIVFGLAILFVLPSLAPAQSGGKTCVQVAIAGQGPSQLACLNQELQSLAQAAAPPAAAVPLGAGSSSNAVGTFNQFGVAEQYGKNFGTSAIPYRPPAPVFSTPPH